MVTYAQVPIDTASVTKTTQTTVPTIPTLTTTTPRILIPAPANKSKQKSQSVLIQPDTTIGVTSSIVMHNPKKALWLSTILPGAGQVYNKQAWKIPIIYGALAGVGYIVWNNYTQMLIYKEDYLYRVNHNGATLLEGYESYPTTNIYNMYQSYNKYFQLFTLIEIGVYGLNLIDAYVFGHLFDFEMDNNLSMSLYPTLQYTPNSMTTPAMGLTIRF